MLLTEQVSTWQSKTNEAIFNKARSLAKDRPSAAYSIYQMAWISASSPGEKLRGLLGMAHCEILLGKKERCAELIRMALTMLALIETDKAIYLEYVYILLSTDGVSNGNSFRPAVMLLEKIAKQNLKKVMKKKSEFEIERWHKGAHLANQGAFFEEARLDGLDTWLRDQNAVAVNYLLSLPGSVDAGATHKKMCQGQRFRRAFLWGNHLFLTESNNRLISRLLDKNERWTLIKDTDFTLTEQFQEIYFSGSGNDFAYQKCHGPKASSICFSTWRTPHQLTFELKGCFPNSGFWHSDDSRFYYVDYERCVDDLEFPHIAVIDPRKPNKEIIYASEDRDALLWSITPNEKDGYLIFLASTESPKKQTALMFLDRQTAFASPVELFKADRCSIESFAERSIWLLSYDKNHPNGQLWKFDWPKIEGDNRQTPCIESSIIIAQSEQTIRRIVVTHKRIIAHLSNSMFNSELHLFTLEGEFVRQLPLPFEGIVADLGKGSVEGEILFSLSSFDRPKELFILNLDSSVSRKVFPDEKYVQFESVSQLTHATASDGTAIPVLLISKHKLENNGKNPVILYGYGGHGVSLFRGYDSIIRAWLEMGGVYAIAAVRGGGEGNPIAHHDALKENKHKSISDFISVAEFLIAEKLTSPQKLGITGTSAGGMLTGSALAKRPELFGAAVIVNGMHDMAKFLGYSKDYGTPRKRRSLDARLLYSPLHNLQPADYPATLLIASIQDQTVPAWHSYKFYTALKKCQQADKPILLRTFDCDHDLRVAYSYPGEQLAFFAHHLGLNQTQDV